MTIEATDLSLGPVRQFVSDLEERNMRLHSLIVHQHGRVRLDLWQWPHKPEHRHKIHSATKSFTATAVAFAEAEGLLSLEDPVLDFLGDRVNSEPDGYLRHMRVRDLLTMRTGHGRGLSGATTRLRTSGWVGEFVEEPVVEHPGRTFRYSSTTSHVLSAIVQRASGTPVDEYLRPRLFAPLGISDFEWERDPEGICSGGNGLTMRPHDLLSFGVLYLQDGVWRGQRILPAGWVQKASAPHVGRAVNGDWNGKELVAPDPAKAGEAGYGYQFWTASDGSYSASGIFGQECMIFPRHDAVVVVTGAMGEPTYHDLPAMMRDAFGRAFDETQRNCSDDADGQSLARWAACAREPYPLDQTRRMCGFTGSYELDANEQGLQSLCISILEDTVRLAFDDDRGHHSIDHGVGHWISQRTGASVWRLHHSYQDRSALISAGAQWADGCDILTLTWHFVESPFIDKLELRFDNDRVSVAHSVNVNSGFTELPLARGVLKRSV